MQRALTPFLLLALLLSQQGCLQLDSAVHSPVHCSTVGAATCEEEMDPFSKLCTPCEEPYDWAITVPWPAPFFDGAAITALRTPQITRRPIQTRDGEGELDLYLIPSHGEVPERATTTIVVQHGNYAGIEHYIPRFKIFHELGYELIVWDYRGYGKSLPETTPTSEQFMEDAHQIQSLLPDLIARMREGRPTADASGPIFYYGMSLGTIPSVEMALQEPAPCGLILEVPFTSIHEIAKTNTGTSLGGGFLTSGDYENVDKIERYTNPLMILHASEDKLFPLESVQKIHDNAGSTDKTLHIIEGAEHGNGQGVPETAGFTRYGELLDTFITRASSGCT